MNHTDTNQRFAACHQQIHTGKVIFNERIFTPPGTLVSNGCRVIAFGLTVHGAPVQVRHPNRNPQSGLPVSLQLMSLEIKIPVRYAVHFTGHTGASLLMGCRCSLLDRVQFPSITQLVYTREGERPVCAHHLTD